MKLERSKRESSASLHLQLGVRLQATHQLHSTGSQVRAPKFNLVSKSKNVTLIFSLFPFLLWNKLCVRENTNLKILVSQYFRIV